MQNIEKLITVLTNQGRSLKEASESNGVMLVFLRHFGCVFCKEAMRDISNNQEEWKRKNVSVILVHMSDEDSAEEYFEKYGLSGIENISDPTCSLYASFGLGKGTASQIFGLKNLIRGFETAAKGLPIGLRQIGDGFQMPGVFLIRKGKVVDSYIHTSASDRPDYDELITCCAS